MTFHWRRSACIATLFVVAFSCIAGLGVIVDASTLTTEVARYVNGVSVDASGTDLCRDSVRPERWAYHQFASGSDVLHYGFAAAAPTSPATSIAVDLAGNSSLLLRLVGPGGVVVHSGSANFRYYSPRALPGRYEISISGPMAQLGRDCGIRHSVTTFVSAWTGVLVYSPMQGFKSSVTPRSRQRACARDESRPNSYEC